MSLISEFCPSMLWGSLEAHNNHRHKGLPDDGRQRFRYDVFVSYSHRNSDWVRGWLVPQLKAAGLKVCVDHESFEPGAPSLTEMERAVLQSRKTVMVLTPEYLQSEWAEFENILGQTLDPAAHRRRLLPVLLMRCEPPRRIQILVRLDFTRSTEHREERVRLIAAIRLWRPLGAYPFPSRLERYPAVHGSTSNGVMTAICNKR